MYFFMLTILLCSVSLSPVSDNIAIPEGNVNEVLYHVYKGSLSRVRLCELMDCSLPGSSVHEILHLPLTGGRCLIIHDPQP